jgi:nitrogen regulatory protein P-II 1
VKLITCHLAPAKLEAVKRALWDKGCRAFSVSTADGLGLQRGRAGNDDEFVSAFQHRVRLEVACRDAELEALLEVIVDAARTGRVGDGKIWVTELQEALRVRTGERGDAAL